MNIWSIHYKPLKKSRYKTSEITTEESIQKRKDWV